MKKLDLHKFNTENEALNAVEAAMTRSGADVAWEIICGAGTHTDVNEYGRKVQETGDWKNKRAPLFFTVKKFVQTKKFRHWIPVVENKQSSIFLRRIEGGDGAQRGEVGPEQVVQVEEVSSYTEDYGLTDSEIRKKVAGEKSGRCPNIAIDTRSRDDKLLGEFAELKLKEESGVKLSNKDKRQLEKLGRRCATIEADRAKEDEEAGSASEEEDDASVEHDCFGNTVSR